jgi:ADP-heptose:LPS heptosyltransferase
MLALPSAVPGEVLTDTRPLALLVPGAAPHRPAKRWPAERYRALAGRLAEMGMAVQLIGAASEIAIAEEIASAAPGVGNLVGRTDLVGLAALGARAAIAIGNDTGPMHLIAAAGAPSVCLFSADSEPALCAPRGSVSVLREADLSALPVEAVLDAAVARMANRGR